MTHLIRLFIDILFLRRGPQDLPASASLLGLLLVANLLVGGLLFNQADSPVSSWTQTFIDLGLQMVMAALVLQIRNFRERTIQTLSAFAGTGLLLSLILLPIVAMLAMEEVIIMREAGRTLFLALMFWSLAIDGHIFRHALSTNMVVGTALAVALFIIRLVILEQLWGSG